MGTTSILPTAGSLLLGDLGFDPVSLESLNTRLDILKEHGTMTVMNILLLLCQCGC